LQPGGQSSPEIPRKTPAQELELPLAIAQLPLTPLT
jgi:hypothetical protein